MAYAQNIKSGVVGWSRPGPAASSSEGEGSDFLRGLRRSAKLGCLVVGIPCFGMLFVVSILLVVSGIAALWIGNSDSQDGVPKFFDNPFDSAGTIMVLTGVLMMVGLLCLWYTAETRNYSLKRKPGRVMNASAPMPSGSYVLTENTYSSGTAENSTVDSQSVLYTPAGGLQHLDHASGTQRHVVQYPSTGSNQLVPSSGEPLEGQMSYPSTPSGTQIPYPSAPSRSQLIFIGPPCGGQMTYPAPPSGRQMPYPASPHSGQMQYTNSMAEPLATYAMLSLPYSSQYPSSNEQAYQPHASRVTHNLCSGLPIIGVSPDDVNIGYANELPPPYTP